MSKKIKNLLYSLVSLFLSLFIKRKDTYIAFGSWEGKLYLDNSKYLVEYIRSQNDGRYKLFWVGEECVKSDLPNDVIFVKKNSFSSIIPLLQCKFMFFSQMHNGDISSFNVFRNAVLIFLNHGICLKKCFTDAAGYNGELEKKNQIFIKRFYGTIVGSYKKYDYFISSSDYHYKTYLSSCAYLGANAENVLKTGTPRNDPLANNTKEQEIMHKIKYSELIGFEKDAKVVLYLPTFRRKKAEVFSLVAADIEQRKKINEILEKYNAVIIEKNHYAAEKFKENQIKAEDFPRLIKLDVNVDLQEMLQFADVQISDYSGSFIDYLHLDRPIIHYLYDYEYYRDFDSGLYLEKEDFVSGYMTENFDELCDALQKSLSGSDDTFNKRENGRKIFIEYESGDSCKKIFDILIKKS